MRDSTAPPPRPHYAEGQVLTATVLTAEQDQRLTGLRRHAAVQHAWGIVAGLALVPDGDDVLVQPGLAVDGFGRALALPAPARLTGDLIDPTGTATARGVWVLYG